MTQVVTDKASVIGQYIFDKVVDNRAALGLEGVFYGDQLQIGKYPTVCVETGEVTKELVGAPYEVMNGFEVYLLVYHAKIQDTQVTRKQTEEFSEAVVNLLHLDKHMDGLVIHGHVTRISPGYSNRGGALLYSTRILWEGMSKTSLYVQGVD